MVLLSDLLSHISVNNVLFPNRKQRIHTISDSSTISEAMNVLLEKRILSAPIVSSSSGEATAMLSMNSLVQYILTTFTEKELNDTHIQKLMKKKEETKNESVFRIFSKVQLLDPAIYVKEGANMYETTKSMVAQKIHRALVLDENNQPLNIVTQSRILKLISVAIESFPSAMEKISNLEIGTSQVIVLPEEKTSYEAFKLMIDKKISGLGVVNSNGKLIGNLSISDIKVLGNDFQFFQLLSKPLNSFLGVVRAGDPYRTIPNIEDPVVCKEDDTLETVVNRLTYFKIHRLYVVNEDGQPLRIISIQDILQYLVDESSGNL